MSCNGSTTKTPPIFCDFLTQWPTLKAVQLARRSTLERFFRDHHVRYADVITQRLHAIKSATPLTTDEGVITPNALLVQALVAQLRVTLHAIEAFDKAIAQRAQTIPTSLYLTPSQALAPSLPHVSSSPLANNATATPLPMSCKSMLALRR